MFGGDRNQIRQVFVDAWQKRVQGKPLEPLEQMIAAVVAEHPEYHKLLDDREAALNREFLPEDGESNPFLHMGMHISLQEQLSTDRPNGIARLYQRLTQRIGDPHEAEHQLMECLAHMLWEAQVNKRMPDEQAYLECVKRLVI
ncbi:MAG: DUF1841 family protein [gamma proteobacterium endosymbiont of Lamellibrachia anaximandri]|nr:DUF1841 family protein [gamma proteobacterium endosymbiont of Lamellibrachia anaximandri]MBL3533299.1 DUF1841 family protein [gamma proteobacterium endosymbiont of Lamellibrachia anaximandri]